MAHSLHWFQLQSQTQVTRHVMQLTVRLYLMTAVLYCGLSRGVNPTDTLLAHTGWFVVHTDRTERRLSRDRNLSNKYRAIRCLERRKSMSRKMGVASFIRQSSDIACAHWIATCSQGTDTGCMPLCQLATVSWPSIRLRQRQGRIQMGCSGKGDAGASTAAQ